MSFFLNLGTPRDIMQRFIELQGRCFTLMKVPTRPFVDVITCTERAKYDRWLSKSYLGRYAYARDSPKADASIATKFERAGVIKPEDFPDDPAFWGFPEDAFVKVACLPGRNKSMLYYWIVGESERCDMGLCLSRQRFSFSSVTKRILPSQST